jgi:putative ABC transport system permease protein
MRWVEDVLADARYGARSFARQPTFTVVALATLALGVGANTVIFSIVSGVLLRPLPYADPDGLVQINQTAPSFGLTALRNAGEYRGANATLESMAGYFPGTRVLRDSNEPERIGVVFAERSIFHVLGVNAAVGRTFRDDDTTGTAVASAAFARRRFASETAAIGQTVTTERERLTIVGVMPESFRLPYNTTRLQGTLAGAPIELWALFDAPINPRSAMDFTVGRLKPGVGLAAARSDLTAIATRLAATFPETSAGIGIELTPLADTIVGSIRPKLLLLLGAVALVLLATCSNVANLLLVRGSTRARDMAIRAAIGADRGRLARQLLTECMVLSIGGAALGFALAAWGTPLVVALAGPLIPRGSDIGIDWRVLTFLLAVSTAMGVAFGMAPGLAAGRVDVAAALSRGSGATTGTRLGKLRDALAAGEIALSFVLVISAALLLRESIRLANTDTGLAPSGVLTMHVTPDLSAAASYDLVSQIEALPGVRAAAFAQMLPLQSWGWTATFSVIGRDPFPPAERPVVELRYVTPRYFNALGIPIRHGRPFSDADTGQSPRVIIVNETLARRYFGTADAVGQQTDRGTIVGVAGDVRQAGLDRGTLPDIYYPIAQNMAQLNDLGMTLIVSTTRPPSAMAGPARDLIRRAAPDLAIFQVKTMEEVVRESLAEKRLYTWMVGSFAVVILVLACAGIYGVLASLVVARTREFGIRLALGAERTGLQWLVLRHAAGLLAIGLGAGIAGALASMSLLDSLIAGAGRLQPLAIGSAATILASVALMACLIPVHRAASIDPIATLRQD